MIAGRPLVYRIATIAILGGFVMLIQPLSHEVFRLGLPVMIVGIVIHALLDHLPDSAVRAVAGAANDGRTP